MSQQTGAGESLVDWLRRLGRRHHVFFTGLARVTDALVPEDLELCRNELQLLAVVLKTDLTSAAGTVC